MVVLECLHTSFKYLCCNLTFCFKFTLLFQICNGVRLQGQIQKIQKERAEYGSVVWTDCCYRLQKHVENKKKKGGHGSLSPSPKSAPGMLIESTFHFSQSESKRSIFLVYNWQWNSNIPVALGQKILNFHYFATVLWQELLKCSIFFYCCEIVTDIDISLSVPGLISVIVFLVIHNFKQVNIWKIICFNCRERYEDIVNHRSSTHNLSIREIKAWGKNVRCEFWTYNLCSTS